MMDLSGRRIALVGGSGFIGHHLALVLTALGAQVDVIDSLQVNNLLVFASSGDNLPNTDLYLDLLNSRLQLFREHRIPLHVLDARDYHMLSPAINRIKPDVVVHLAGVAHANRANKDPYSTFDHSLRTLENALDSCRGNVEHFIYFSSSMVYGNFEGGKVDEDSVCNPLGIYGALKFAGEKLVMAYNQVFGLPYTIIRPSALYGERCVSRRVGQIFIENAAQGLEISINGDGSDSLDFTYIDDLVQGVIKSIGHPAARNQVFNITYGEGRSIASMAMILKEHFPKARINYLPKDKLMPDRGTLAVDKARALIGYEPAYPLEKGFVKYIKWYKDLFRDHASYLVKGRKAA
jgi:nucleoside-diphosphate-sugar epimerase